MCHLAGAVLARWHQRAFRAKYLCLAAGCAFTLAALWFIPRAARAAWFPVFFIPGHGGTPVRYCVLSAAITLVASSAMYAADGTNSQILIPVTKVGLR